MYDLSTWVNSWWRCRCFSSTMSIPGLGPIHLSKTIGNRELFTWGQSGEGMVLINHFHLVMNVKKHWTYSSIRRPGFIVGHEANPLPCTVQRNGEIIDKIALFFLAHTFIYSLIKCTIFFICLLYIS